MRPPDNLRSLHRREDRGHYGVNSSNGKGELDAGIGCGLNELGSALKGVLPKRRRVLPLLVRRTSGASPQIHSRNRRRSGTRRARPSERRIWATRPQDAPPRWVHLDTAPIISRTKIGTPDSVGRRATSTNTAGLSRRSGGCARMCPCDDASVSCLNQGRGVGDAWRQASLAFVNRQSVTPSGRHSELWAWFGAQVGSTIWLVRVAWILGWHASPQILCLVLVCFAVSNLVGLTLWFRRRRMGLWRAWRSLVVAITVCDLVAMISLRGRLQFSRELSPGTFVAFVLLMAVLFIILHRRASRNRDA